MNNRLNVMRKFVRVCGGLDVDCYESLRAVICDTVDYSSYYCDVQRSVLFQRLSAAEFRVCKS